MADEAPAPGTPAPAAEPAKPDAPDLDAIRAEVRAEVMAKTSAEMDALLKDPEGRAWLANQYGLKLAEEKKAPEPEEPLDPTEAKLAKLEKELAEYRAAMEELQGKTTQAQVAAFAGQFKADMTQEFQEFLEEQPELQEEPRLVRKMWDSVFGVIENNPQFAKPGSVKSLAKAYLEEAEIAREGLNRIRETSARGRAGGGAVLPKKAEDMTEDEAREAIASMMGLG